jgi:hypothetical protein
MRLGRILGALLVVGAVPLIVGCASVSYRERATAEQTRYSTIENFSDEAITAEQVDGLLEEVADILHVTLDPQKPKVRIMVVAPSRIAEMYRRVMTVAAHGADAVALYFPGASLVMIPHYDRLVLGHELAHYVTDHYLRSAPRRDWEKIAHRVEDALPHAAPVAKRVTPGTEVTALVAEPIARAAE